MMEADVELHSELLKDRILAALQWLRRSIEVQGGRGSSAFYSPWRHPLKKWAPAYPETTGYLLPTLARAEQYVDLPWITPLLSDCGEWLLEMALEEGAFPELYGHTGKPSLFNTGQILFGLVEMWHRSKDVRYQFAIERALEWMLAVRWSERPQPTYYSRAWWGALVAARSLGDGQAELDIAEVLDELASRFRPNGALRAWGFAAHSRAYTHTIAYSLRGFYEAGKLLKRIDWADKVWNSLQQLEVLYRRHGKLAGMYDENWKGRYAFICVPGHAQLSVLYALVARDLRRGFADFYPSGASLSAPEGDAHVPMERMSRQLLRPLLKVQRRRGGENLRGALPGSVPFWGPYQPLRYPNWAAKFFVDAVLCVWGRGLSAG